MKQTDTITAHLLIAMPGMEDHRFAQSVIYLCAHSEDGAMGLIINRPLPELKFSKLLKHLEIAQSEATPDVQMHYGGPVERGRGFVLHDAGYHAPQGTMRITPDMSLSASLDVVSHIAAGTGPSRMIFGLGYAGWGPGQLEAEIRQNVWLVADADPQLIFNTPADQMWHGAMSHAGIDLRILSSHHGHA